MIRVETIVVALIVSLVAPLVLAVVTGWQRRGEKREDWARQDKVADRVADVAKTATVAAETAAKAQESNAATLKDIHALVNSDMTAARTAELVATRLLVVALRKLTPDAATDEAIDTAEHRVDELEAILADRLVAQRLVESNAREREIADA